VDCFHQKVTATFARDRGLQITPVVVIGHAGLGGVQAIMGDGCLREPRRVAARPPDEVGIVEAPGQGTDQPGW